MNPVNSYGGGVCCTGNAVQGGAFDQRKMEEREDILVYTSAPLKEGIEVSGFIESELYLSSDVKDTSDNQTHWRSSWWYSIQSRRNNSTCRKWEGYDKEVFIEKGSV